MHYFNTNTPFCYFREYDVCSPWIRKIVVGITSNFRKFVSSFLAAYTLTQMFIASLAQLPAFSSLSFWLSKFEGLRFSAYTSCGNAAATSFSATLLLVSVIDVLEVDTLLLVTHVFRMVVPSNSSKNIFLYSFSPLRETG